MMKIKYYIYNFVKNYILKTRDFIFVSFDYFFKKDKILKIMLNRMNGVYNNSLTLEATNVCNADCVFCIYGKKDDKKFYMDMNLFKKIADEFLLNSMNNNRTVSLTPTIGDPLVDPFFIERLDYLKRTNVGKVVFFTNAINLSNKLSNKLVNDYADILDIHISWGGYDRETYKKVMGVDKFERALSNVKYLIKIIGETKTNFKLDISSRCSPLDYRGDVWNEFKVFQQNGLIGISKIDIFDNWGGEIDKKDLEEADLQMKYEPLKKGACKLLFQPPVIHADGIVSACHCRDSSSSLKIGDINSMSYTDILNSEKRLEIIKQQQNGTFPDICQKCNTYVSIYNKFWREAN